MVKLLHTYFMILKNPLALFEKSVQIIRPLANVLRNTMFHVSLKLKLTRF